MWVGKAQAVFLCGCLGGVSIKLGALPYLLIALGIEVEILLLFAKDFSGKPDLKGNALKKTYPILGVPSPTFYWGAGA